MGAHLARDLPGWNHYRFVDEFVRLEPMMNDFKPMIKMATEAITEAKSLVSYCDYIAETIKHALPGTGVVTSHVQPDLMSSSKTVFAEYLGKNYKITVEEA